MQPEFPDILATRLEVNVAAFRGHTRQELFFIGLFSWLGTVVVLGVLTRCLLGLFMVGLGLSFPLAIPVAWVFIRVLQKLKAGKPQGFLRQQFLLWLDAHGVKQSPFVRYSGTWSIQRELP